MFPIFFHQTVKQHQFPIDFFSLYHKKWRSSLYFPIKPWRTPWISHLSPSQSIRSPWISHSPRPWPIPRSCWVGVGQGSASWLGGLVLHRYGDQRLFQCSALLALLAALGPFSVAICGGEQREQREQREQGARNGEKCPCFHFSHL